MIVAISGEAATVDGETHHPFQVERNHSFLPVHLPFPHAFLAAKPDLAASYTVAVAAASESLQIPENSVAVSARSGAGVVAAAASEVVVEAAAWRKSQQQKILYHLASSCSVRLPMPLPG